MLLHHCQGQKHVNVRPYLSYRKEKLCQNKIEYSHNTYVCYLNPSVLHYHPAYPNSYLLPIPKAAILSSSNLPCLTDNCSCNPYEKFRFGKVGLIFFHLKNAYGKEKGLFH